MIELDKFGADFKSDLGLLNFNTMPISVTLIFVQRCYDLAVAKNQTFSKQCPTWYEYENLRRTLATSEAC